MVPTIRELVVVVVAAACFGSWVWWIVEYQEMSLYSVYHQNTECIFW